MNQGSRKFFAAISNIFFRLKEIICIKISAYLSHYFDEHNQMRENDSLHLQNKLKRRSNTFISVLYLTVTVDTNDQNHWKPLLWLY